MIDRTRAITIVKRSLPKGTIQKVVEYKSWFLFMVFTSDPNEGQMDAIYSVDKMTGQFSDFPYLKKEYFEDVMDLFEKTQKYNDVSRVFLTDRVKKAWKVAKLVKKSNIP